MMITYSDLVQTGVFIVALIGLCYTVFKGKRKQPPLWLSLFLYIIQYIRRHDSRAKYPAIPHFFPAKNFELTVPAFLPVESFGWVGWVRGASIYSRYSHKRMEEKANEMSVDVIVGSSYSTYNLIGGAAEIIVYVWYSSRICLKARGIRDE